MINKKNYSNFIINLIFVVIVLGLNSCATIINQPTVEVNVHCNVDSVRICINDDSTKWYETPVTINVKRSENDLLLIAKKDTIQKIIPLESSYSTAFWLGNMFSGAGIIGYIVDSYSPKRFTYPSEFTINFKSPDQIDTITTSFNWLLPEQHLFCYKIAIPEGNFFYLNQGNGYGKTAGFLGISLGFEYYFNDIYNANIDFGALMDFPIPFPAPIDYVGGYEHSSASYVDVQIGRDFGRIHFDFGLQYNNTFYKKAVSTEEDSPNIDSVLTQMDQKNFGIALSSYFRISNSVNIGVNYYPSFVSLNNSGISSHYSHILFFELLFRIEVYRP